MHSSMRSHDEAVVARFAQQDPTPIVDQIWDVDRPIDFSNFAEHRPQQIVKRNLAVEGHHEIVNLRSGVKVRPASGHHSTSPAPKTTIASVDRPIRPRRRAAMEAPRRTSSAADWLRGSFST